MVLPTLMQVGNLHPRWRIRNHPAYPMAMQKEGLKPQPSDYAPLHGAVVTETSTPVSAGPTQVPQEVHDIARIRQHLPNDKLMVQARVKDLADELVQTFNSNGKNAAGGCPPAGNLPVPETQEELS